MQKQYELWLDESGNFENQSELKNKKIQKPSLVGGLLLENDDILKIDFNSFMPSKKGHACEMGGNDKVDKVLPYLEKMKKDYSARQVFFENSEYEDEDSNRLLYLRVISEGILQLMQTLSAKNEEVYLKIIIAQRQDVSSKTNRRINEMEYKNTLEELIESKKREHKIFFVKNSKIEFVIEVAAKTKKLMLADFACNTRLTRDSKAFNKVRDRVMFLYTDAYIFSLYEMGLENSIRRRLSGGNISDAIMELYLYIDLVTDNVNNIRKAMLDEILERMNTMSYRLIKSQLKQCIQEITAYISNISDYEKGEAFLKSIIKTLIPRLNNKENGKEYPIDKFKFNILILLSDMYLREGDINNAEKTLKECKIVHQKMNDNLEDIFLYYQLLEKEALLAIDSFDYKRGSNIMEEACKGFELIIGAISSNSLFTSYFKDFKSEYYGDALCMQIYAKMFMQRHNPDSYSELCNLSDLALLQYSGPESELERHRQYRAHIEAEEGNYTDAIKWLFKAKCMSLSKVDEDSLIGFLNTVNQTEEEISCQYYFMYYLHIMSEAAYKGEKNISETMYKATLSQHKMLELCGIRGNTGNEGNLIGIDIDSVSDKDTGISYHPEEVLLWKYGSYLYNMGKGYIAAPYFEKAYRLCEKYSDYFTMIVTGIGIRAELVCCYIGEKKKKEADNLADSIIGDLGDVFYKTSNENTKSFLKELTSLALAGFNNGSVTDKSKFLELSRRITY